jgi:hypothetical protein
MVAKDLAVLRGKTRRPDLAGIHIMQYFSFQRQNRTELFNESKEFNTICMLMIKTHFYIKVDLAG